MQLTRYTDYSIRVLTHLSTFPERLCCIADIAQAYQISQSHLMKVVQDLGQSGYLETVRGRNGGIRAMRLVSLRERSCTGSCHVVLGMDASLRQKDSQRRKILF